MRVLVVTGANMDGALHMLWWAVGPLDDDASRTAGCWTGCGFWGCAWPGPHSVANECLNRLLPWFKNERMPGDEGVMRMLVQWVPESTAGDNGNAGHKAGYITEGS